MIFSILFENHTSLAFMGVLHVIICIMIYFEYNLM